MDQLTEALQKYIQQAENLIYSIWDHPDREFTVLNYSAVLFWSFLVLWCLIPRLGKFCRAVVQIYAFVISVFYAVKFYETFGKNFDFEKDKELDLLDFAAVSESFKNPKVLIIGWAHYIAFDILVGASLVQKIAKYGFITRMCFIPILPLICLLGPIGLVLAFLGLWASSHLRSHEKDKQKIE